MLKYKLHLICCFLSLLVLTILPGTTALAHVSSDSMPDSVAEVEYSIFLEFKPNDLVVRNKLGMVYYRLNKLDEAEREFTRILKADAKNSDALDGLGLVKAARNNYDQAVMYYIQAIALNPGDMMVYYHLGVALEKNGKFPEAAEAYRNALAKWNEQYQAGTPNKKAVEFAETVKAALHTVESKL